MDKIGITNVNVSIEVDKDVKRGHTTFQFIQPTYIGLELLHMPSKHANQPWKKRNKNSRL